MVILIFHFLSLSEQQNKSLHQTKPRCSTLPHLVHKDAFALPVFITLFLLLSVVITMQDPMEVRPVKLTVRNPTYLGRFTDLSILEWLTSEWTEHRTLAQIDSQALDSVYAAHHLVDGIRRV